MEISRDLIYVVVGGLNSPYDEHIKYKIGVFFDKVINIKKHVAFLSAQFTGTIFNVYIDQIITTTTIDNNNQRQQHQQQRHNDDNIVLTHEGTTS